MTTMERDVLRDHSDIAGSLAFCLDGAVLVAACGQSLWAWDLRRGRVLSRVKLDRLVVQAMAPTPDGRFVAAVRNDGAVRFWDCSTWRECAVFDWEIGPLVSLAFAPDGLRGAAGNRRGEIVVWDVDL
jgi:WD40 repeat protein